MFIKTSTLLSCARMKYSKHAAAEKDKDKTNPKLRRRMIIKSEAYKALFIFPD